MNVNTVTSCSAHAIVHSESFTLGRQNEIIIYAEGILFEVSEFVMLLLSGATTFYIISCNVCVFLLENVKE